MPQTRGPIPLRWHRGRFSSQQIGLSAYILTGQVKVRLSSQSSTRVIATVLVSMIVVVVLVGYGYYGTSTSLSSMSEQNSSLGQQISNLSQQNLNVGQQVSNQNQQISNLNQQVSNGNQQVSDLNQQVSTLEQRTLTVVTMTNTIITVQTTTSVSTQTSYVTDTAYSTVTTTSSVYPPSSSSYALTYVSGNATETIPSCGAWTVAVDVTYEVHQPVSTNIIQWAEFPSGELVQPSTQSTYFDQAYLTIYSTYSGNSGICGGGQISSLSAFVSDTNNNQLSPSTYFIVQS